MSVPTKVASSSRELRLTLVRLSDRERNVYVWKGGLYQPANGGCTISVFRIGDRFLDDPDLCSSTEGTRSFLSRLHRLAQE